MSYFLNYKPPCLDILSTKTIYQLKNETVYRFHTVSDLISEFDSLYFQITVCKSTSENEIQLHFSFATTSAYYYQKDKEVILNKINGDEFLNYFFNDIKKVRIQQKEDVQFNQNICSLYISLKGDLKFKIENEYHLMDFVELEPELKNLTNKKTMNYISRINQKIRTEWIQRFINIEENKLKDKKIVLYLSELLNSFDINSEDYLNALILYYDD